MSCTSQKSNIPFLFIIIIFSATYLNAQNAQPFWEKVPTQVINPPYPNSESYRTVDKLPGTIRSFVINTEGVMAIGIGGTGKGIYISSNSGKTWQHKSPESTTHMHFHTNGKEFISNYDIDRSIGRDEHFYLVSEDGLNWKRLSEQEVVDSKRISLLRTSDRRDFSLPDGTKKVIEDKGLFEYKDSEKAYVYVPSSMSRKLVAIRKISKTCDGIYYAHVGKINYMSRDDRVYRPMITNFFEVRAHYQFPSEDFRILPTCKLLFATGKKKGDREYDLFVQDPDTKKWERIGGNKGTIRYNPADKRYYQYNNSSIYDDRSGLLRSVKQYDCDCTEEAEPEPGSQESEESKEASSYAFDVSPQGSVPLVAQPNQKSCWAAAATMVLNWKNKTDLSIGDALRERSYMAWLKFQNTTDDNSMMQNGQQLYALWIANLKFTDGGNLPITIDRIKSLIGTYGPVVLGINGYPTQDQFVGHAVVVTRMYGEGGEEDTHVVYHDPADGGAVKTETYAAFMERVNRYREELGFRAVIVLER